jgi:hypothetical protein
VQADAITPIVLPTFDVGPVTKIRIKADGEIMATHTVDGRLQSQGGRPSSCRIGADGNVKAAARHDQGTAADMWKAGQGVGMTIDIQMLAGECYSLADELRQNGGQDGFADALDTIGVRAEALGGRGYAALPLSLHADGKVNVTALDESSRRQRMDVTAALNDIGRLKRKKGASTEAPFFLMGYSRPE